MLSVVRCFSSNSINRFLLKNVPNSTKGRYPPVAGGYFFMGTDNEKTALSDTVQDSPKSRTLQPILAVSQEAVSQKHQMKVKPKRIDEEVMLPPDDSLLQALTYHIAISFLHGPEVLISYCLRDLSQAAPRVDPVLGLVQMDRIHVSSQYFQLGEAMIILAYHLPQDS